MSAAKLTYGQIQQQFDALDRREARMKGFYTSLGGNPNESTTVPEALSANFDEETTAAMQHNPMLALTNFGMGYLADFKDTRGKAAINDAKGNMIRHRFADVLEYEEKEVVASEQGGSDEEDFPSMQPGTLSSSMDRNEWARASSRFSLNSSLGSSAGSAAFAAATTVARSMTPDAAALEKQVVARMNEEIERRTAALTSQLEDRIAKADTAARQPALFDSVLEPAFQERNGAGTDTQTAMAAQVMRAS